MTDTRIEDLNERIKILESQVPIPASVKPVPPRYFNQIQAALYIWNFVEGNLGVQDILILLFFLFLSNDFVQTTIG
jgi:hypothetical protein